MSMPMVMYVQSSARLRALKSCGLNRGIGIFRFVMACAMGLIMVRQSVGLGQSPGGAGATPIRSRLWSRPDMSASGLTQQL